MNDVGFFVVVFVIVIVVIVVVVYAAVVVDVVQSFYLNAAQNRRTRAGKNSWSFG